MSAEDRVSLGLWLAILATTAVWNGATAQGFCIVVILVGLGVAVSGWRKRRRAR